MMQMVVVAKATDRGKNRFSGNYKCVLSEPGKSIDNALFTTYRTPNLSKPRLVYHSARTRVWKMVTLIVL